MMRNCVRCFLACIIIAGIGVVSKPIVKGSSEPGIEGEKNSGILSNVGENFHGSTELSEEKNPLGSSLAWILAPFINKIEFTAGTLIEERIEQIKKTLANLAGSIFPNQETDPGSKQLPVNIKGIGNLLGLNGSGFYPNRIDPAGFFGGNGWFANKGGILGGPGALISTGSLFTDYQTPYKK